MLHGKGYDGKNMGHTFRLLETAREIAEGKGIIVKRPNREKLLEIRRGIYDYNDLVSEAMLIKDSLHSLYEKSNLPEQVKKGLSNEILLQVRKHVYKL